MTTPEVHPLSVRLKRLGEQTARQVMELVDQLDAGTITARQLPELVAPLVKLGGDQAEALVVGELVRELSEATGVVARDTGLARVTRETDIDAVERAAVTVMSGAEKSRKARLSRLARGAVSHAAQESRGRAIRESPLTSGWTRGLDSTSCQLCRWWWREGRVWPKTHHMPRHPGCDCVQVPVLSRNVVGVSREAQADAAERRRLESSGSYLDAFGTNRRGQVTPAMRARGQGASQ